MIALAAFALAALVGFQTPMVIARLRARRQHSNLAAAATLTTNPPHLLQSLQQLAQGIEDAFTREPILDSLANCIDRHAAVLDEITALDRERARVLTVLPAGSRAAVERARTQLHLTRDRALERVHMLLERAVPDLRLKLADSPVQAGSSAIAVLSVVGLTWLCGYYGTVGVEFMPFLRSLDDVALIGFTSGAVPLILFVALVVLALMRVARARDAARRASAHAWEISSALRTARQLHRYPFWISRAIAALFLVLGSSMFAGFHPRLHPLLTVSANDVIFSSEQFRTLGGVGDFVVLRGESSGRIATIPADKLTCLSTRTPGLSPTSGSDTEDEETPLCKTRSDERGTDPEIIANTITAVMNLLDERDTWRAFVQEAAQCHVIAPVGPFPLLSPAFEDNQGKQFDLRHYAHVLRREPYNKECVDLRSQTDAQIRDCVQRTLRIKLAEWQKMKTAGEHFILNFIGFASGTKDPSYNEDLAKQRADSIVKLVCEGSAVCGTQVRTKSYSEMPYLPWLARQGDWSERTVLIAACDEDI